MQWPFLRGGERFAPAIQTAAVCTDIDTLAALAVAGAGVTRLGSFVANPLIATGQLEPLLMATGSSRARTLADPEPLEFFACFRDRQHLPAPVRVFVDFLAEALQDHPLLRVSAWPRTGV